MKDSIKITLYRLADDKACFLTPDNREVIIPRDLLPENLEVGSVLHLRLSPKETQLTLDQAKALLEEVLNGEEK